jgi:uracil-DNA glycosylase
MHLKPVFIGQMPGNDNDTEALPIRPGSSGMRLVQMMGVTQEAFEQNFIRMNVDVNYDPDGFHVPYAKTCAQNFLPLLEHRRVILLGPPVAACFGYERQSFEWCRWFDHDTLNISFAVIPHPSGRNFLYNEPWMMSLVSEFLDQVWHEMLRSRSKNHAAA